jgi:hypothetical protein
MFPRNLGLVKLKLFIYRIVAKIDDREASPLTA